MGYSEIVSTAAFLLALSAAWRTWRWDRPVIRVAGEQWLGGLGTAELHKASFTVEISNTGNHATQILSASWQIERKNSSDAQTIPASYGGGGTETLFEPPRPLKEPEFPFILDRNHREAWDFEMSLNGLGDYDVITRLRPAVEFISRKHRRVVYGAWRKPKRPPEQGPDGRVRQELQT